MAFVVAIAGMIFPAISTINSLSYTTGKELKLEVWVVRLMSNFDFVGMEKMVERMFAVEETKSSVSTSSLSKVKTCTASGV